MMIMMWTRMTIELERLGDWPWRVPRAHRLGGTRVTTRAGARAAKSGRVLDRCEYRLGERANAGTRHDVRAGCAKRTHKYGTNPSPLSSTIGHPHSQPASWSASPYRRE